MLGGVAVAAGDLVGRDEELALLDAAAGDGSGSIVVAGPVGVGKSRLVEEFLGRLKADRVRQVLVRATRSTATIPFGAFAAWAPEQTAEAVGWLDRDPLRVAPWWLESGTTQGPPEVFLAAATHGICSGCAVDRAPRLM
jgi:predicted ATPase